MNEDEHADDCQVVQARTAQIAWPGDALCTCRHWRQYNNAVPPAWFVEQLVNPMGEEK